MDNNENQTKYVAYFGDPNGRIFGRVKFSSEIQYLMSMWNDGALYGGHKAEEETELDRIWMNAPVARPAP
jgi:hypothetical protein